MLRTIRPLLSHQLTAPHYTFVRRWPRSDVGHGNRVQMPSAAGAARGIGGGFEKPLSQKPADGVPQTSQPAAARIVEKSRSEKSQKSDGKIDILNNTAVVNKEQRKADWAIMKEMVKYLWPKVRSLWRKHSNAVMLSYCRMIGVRSFGLGLLLHSL
jgi:hypothetical protein